MRTGRACCERRSRCLCMLCALATASATGTAPATAPVTAAEVVLALGPLITIRLLRAVVGRQAKAVNVFNTNEEGRTSAVFVSVKKIPEAQSRHQVLGCISLIIRKKRSAQEGTISKRPRGPERTACALFIELSGGFEKIPGFLENMLSVVEGLRTC
eukprot:2320128-Pleurochrysis_carterae.AAC.1